MNRRLYALHEAYNKHTFARAHWKTVVWTQLTICACDCGDFFVILADGSRYSFGPHTSEDFLRGAIAAAPEDLRAEFYEFIFSRADPSRLSSLSVWWMSIYG